MAAPSQSALGEMMYPALPRHKIQLSAAELRLACEVLLGQADVSGGRARFEASACRYFGVPHALAVESGRTALHLALTGLGLQPGARVVLPRYCFYSLVHVVQGMGFTPIYAPVDPHRYGLDPDGLVDLLDDADAVVLIHPFGQVGAIEDIASLCAHRGVPLIEDASQATGARLGQRRVGRLADIAVFSLVSGKNLQTFGGGLMLTEDDTIHRRANAAISVDPDSDKAHAKFKSGLLRWFLTTPIGFNALMHPLSVGLDLVAPGRLEAMFHEERASYDPGQPIHRLSDAQGAFGCLGLDTLDARNAHRRNMALRLLDGLKGADGLWLPDFDEGAENTFNAVAVRCPDATALSAALRMKGIDTRTDYMEWFGGEQDFEEEVLYLPNHPGLAPKDVDRVVRAVRDVLR